MTSSSASTLRQIARAAGTVMAALLSNLVGLLRWVLVSRAFGTLPEIEAYIGHRIPVRQVDAGMRAEVQIPPREARPRFRAGGPLRGGGRGPSHGRQGSGGGARGRNRSR